MIYIFEGIDNVGKSTQISKLNKVLASKSRWPLNIHCTNFGDKSLDYSISYYNKLIKEVIWLSDRDIYDVILDRSWLGENVYCPMYRNTSGDYVFELERKLILPNDKYGFRLITMIDSSLNVLDREDGASFSTDSDMKSLEIKLFKETHEKSFIKHKLLVDIANLDEHDVWNLIELFLFKAE